MDIESLEVRQHLARFPPFDALSDELLDAVADTVEVAYFKSGTDILKLDQEINDLHYIRSGAVDIYRRNGTLYDRLSEGDIFGHFALLRNQRVRFPAKAIEDTLIYYIPRTTFDRLCEADEQFADFVELEKPRLETTVEKTFDHASLTTRVRKLITRSPLMLNESTPVQEAARLIRDSQNPSVLVLGAPDDDPEQLTVERGGERRRLVGLVTDSDFRNRVVAEGLPPETPVGEVASRDLITIQSDETVQEATLSMLRNNIHHLPVLHRRRPVGLLHLSDILRHETHSSLYLVDSIYRARSVKHLIRLRRDARDTFVGMEREGANSQMIGSAQSTIGRSFTRRLLELAEEALGPPPVPYCFMVLGSMARHEQTIVTDQDNALILDDRFDPEQHDDYFAELAKQVSDGLAELGYTYCKGGIMATNPQWRQPLRVWKEYFRDWILQPTPERLLHSSIFFDLESCYGEEVFVEQLQDLAANLAPRHSRFLAALARNALNRTPPLGFWRDFVMEKDGKQNNIINLKGRGTAPMVDLVRVHALACGSTAQNTFDRLDDISKTTLLPKGVGEKLRYAFEFMSMVRIRHQVADIQNDRPPDNYIEPENLSDTERHNLKDAFQVLSNAQRFLRFRYPMP
ncbi:putative nucleotidyltransferase substrate binding domain-containing protein [Alkalilimnicola ehrlichii MLHE-1]|uniref:Cyclic nucleotide-binding protein n=1 Tax=Alkalilimnicola ehrlichii (strain ATCC BAA-1101 / DSM 17681 / MLHE-1) TaxID=187272 RepID=Q0AAE6_ALKEH|nr:DUF294 nucleotidyltransferase-like domain-containing protein [Alkalilimnicola ehrlichii]ABI56191.1 cyclic nucleotide-binding protein [Alkalilimnicola ehrlichii MLHE-1]